MRRLIVSLLALTLLAAGCSRQRDDDRGAEPSSGGSNAGGVRIQTTSAELDLALVGDTISAGLAPDALAKAREATDSAKVRATGLGGSIERMVKSTVQSAVSSRVSFPVSDVRDVRYEDGAIRFEWNHRPTRLFDQTKVNGKPFLESFSPDDAERFVQAVRARIRTAQ
jgi:surface antigen